MKQGLLKTIPYTILKVLFRNGWLLLISLASIAQPPHLSDSGQSAWYVGLQGHYGFIIPHSSTVRHIANSNPWGLEADLSVHFAEAKAWEYLQAYPRLGAAFAFYDFNNPAVLGRAYALTFYAEPFFSAHKNFSFSFRLGAGLAYLDKPFHAETNPQNLFYSTAISFPLVANFMANYRLGKQYLLRAGASYQHISNGGLRQPNKGINFPTASLGLHYALRAGQFPQRKSGRSLQNEGKTELLAALIGTYRDRSDVPQEQAPLLGITTYLTHRIGRLSALMAGGEWIADFALKKDLDGRGVAKDFQRGGLLAGHELQIGRIRFSQQLGLYVYAPQPAQEKLYQRWGLEYHSAKSIFFGINLKAHRHVADFLDLRVGAKIN